jgi:hypothetical protein
MPRISATTAAASHGSCPAATDPAKRVMIARSDWLPAQPMNPVRLPSDRIRPCSHHSDESCGRTANPTATVTRNPITVVTPPGTAG